MKEKMKLTKSKQFLADAIHASGKGWPDVADFAVQDKYMWICLYEGKPTRRGDNWFDDGDCLYKLGFAYNKISPNWHQTCLSRDEYFSAYPAEPAADADGWIEWLSDELPVDKGTIIDVKYSDGDELHGAPCGIETENLISIRGDEAGAELFGHSDCVAYIIAYRLHKPEVKSVSVGDEETNLSCKEELESLECSESPEQRAKLAEIYKPSIEQLAADYRNAKDYAERKQQEADEAKADAEANLALLVEAGKAHGLVVSPITTKQWPELVITNINQLELGDVIWISDSTDKLNNELTPAGEYTVVKVGVIGVDSHGQTVYPDFSTREWRFIRRP